MSIERKKLTRRQVLKSGIAASTFWAASQMSFKPGGLMAYVPDNPKGERPERDPSIQVLHPRKRIPLSFIIDDSTCLVNMGHYCMPQFAAAWPKREIYKKPWKTWPREIPDSFVREFGEWCHDNKVKGKYSIVPNPACVGWLDRDLPGWSRKDLQDSLKLVRELMMPDWDIHPEMITHTRVIDIKTGRPFEEINAHTMENSFPRKKISVDYLASYLEYALKILKNCDLPCEGITTPGGFGSFVKSELGLASYQSVKRVFNPEIPHYFKYVAGGKESTEPMVEHVKGLKTENPQLVVNIPAGTGDWFGGWDGDLKSQGHKYSNDDATQGRMVELIERGDPAIMLCHWPGMYSQGTLEGYKDFQRVVKALNTRFKDSTQWMKLSTIARYWACKELTERKRKENTLFLNAPFSCPDYTLQTSYGGKAKPVWEYKDQKKPLQLVQKSSELKEGTFLQEGNKTILCIQLPKGKSKLTLA